MKRKSKMLTAVCSAVVSAVVCAAAVSAETYELEISPSESNGQHGQSVTYHTALAVTKDDAGDFDPTAMTTGSVVHVEYETAYEGDETNVELIWQSWMMHGDPHKTDCIEWAKVAPYETGDGWADFSYDDIVAGYNTDDFSEVYSINIGDNGLGKLTVKSISIIIPDEDENDITETEEEHVPDEYVPEHAVEETTTETESGEEVSETTVTSIVNVANTDRTADIVSIVLAVFIVLMVGGIAYFIYIFVRNAKPKNK